MRGIHASKGNIGRNLVSNAVEDLPYAHELATGLGVYQLLDVDGPDWHRHTPTRAGEDLPSDEAANAAGKGHNEGSYDDHGGTRASYKGKRDDVYSYR